MTAIVSLAVIAALAILFVVLLWARSEKPGNERADLGHNSPWPDTVFPGMAAHRPPLGTPESLDNHEDLDWVHSELGREETRRKRGH